MAKQVHNTVEGHRIGMILPSVNIRMEPEYYRCKELENFNFYSTRVMLDDTTEETLRAMEKDLEQAARMIATVFPEAVIYGCTSGSFISGSGGNSHIIDTIESICHCPAVTASQAMVQSMQELGVQKITLVTPYTDDINEKEKDFFQANGIQVAAMRGLQIVEAEDLRTRSAEDIVQLVQSTDVPESQAVFISCANVEGFHICDALERRLGKPVVTSNIASLWAVLRLVGHHVHISGHGMLLREHLGRM